MVEDLRAGGAVSVDRAISEAVDAAVASAARAAASPWAGSIAAVLRASRPWRCPHHRLRRIGRAQHACLECLECGVGVVETGL